MSEEKGGSAELPDDIDLHPPGTEMDCLLAQRVLGATIKRYTEFTGYINVVATTPDGTHYFIVVSPHSIGVVDALWNPSINLSDAQMLLQHLYRNFGYNDMAEGGDDESGYAVTLWPKSQNDERKVSTDEPEWGNQKRVTAYGSTAALALCRAVYKAASDMQPPQTEAE